LSDSISHPLSRPPSAQPPHRRRLARDGRAASGFTLVEILTVISIIVVLIGLLFVAIKYARNSAARSTTAAQMDTLRGMLGELDSANHFSASPPVWLWFNAGPSYIVTNANCDFWKYPDGSYSGFADCALDSPGDVRSDSGSQSDSQRNSSCAILNTQLAMQMLASVPANRSALDKLSANAKVLPTWNNGPVLGAITGAGASTPFVGLLREDGTDSTMSAVNYLQGMHVTYQGKFFSCVVTPTAGTAPVPSGSTPWLDESASPRGAPILLDGWGNPIIYVPATGLHVKLLNGQGAYLPADPSSGPTQEFIIISPEGSVSGNGTAHPQVTRPGRPFFASAGPDGDFTKGDDNLYSFQN
jgi:type II secretory pathway pseudopilin PulG